MNNLDDDMELPQPENPLRMKARVDGACAALEGKKLGANPHPEGSDFHWEWMQGWTSAKRQKLRMKE